MATTMQELSYPEHLVKGYVLGRTPATKAACSISPGLSKSYGLYIEGLLLVILQANVS